MKALRTAAEEGVGAELEGERIGETEHPRLRGGVVRMSDRSPVGGLRRDVQDASAPGSAHPGDHRTGQPERRREIDQEYLIPLGVTHRLDHRTSHDPGVIDEDGRGAECGVRGGHDRVRG